VDEKLTLTLRKMKKRSIKGFILYYLCILFLFALSNDVYSQEKAGLSFGAKAGLASGSLSTSHYIEASSAKNGYQAGIVVNYSILDYLDVTLEVMYSNSGASNLNPEYFYAAENAVLTDK